jgi:hypothetical protein
MTDQPAEEAHRTGRSVRLDTLVRLRWLAVIGQTTAVLVVYVGLDYELPIWGCLAVIALAAWLNVALRIRFPMTQRLEPDRAAWLLAFDIAELAVLLFFTGGLQNPFAFLFLGPVLISATALPPRMTLMLGGFASPARRCWFSSRSSAVGHRAAARIARRVCDGGLACHPALDRIHRPACRGRSPRVPPTGGCAGGRPSWCSRASSTSRSSTDLRRRPPMSSARRSPPSP